MLQKLLRLGALIMVAQLTTPAHSINHKLLDQEAGCYVHKIWTGIRVPKDEIKVSLGFINESDTVDTKYTQKGNFKNLYKKINDEIGDHKLAQFAKECRSLRKDNSDKITKIAVHLLLERVTEEYSKVLAKAEKAKSLNNPRILDDSEMNKLFNIFLNADNSITIK